MINNETESEHEQKQYDVNSLISERNYYERLCDKM
jgi:hypothetical protein